MPRAVDALIRRFTPFFNQREAYKKIRHRVDHKRELLRETFGVVISDKWAARVMGTIAILAVFASALGFVLVILAIVASVRHG